jgi:hypothetical protein
VAVARSTKTHFSIHRKEGQEIGMLALKVPKTPLVLVAQNSAGDLACSLPLRCVIDISSLWMYPGAVHPLAVPAKTTSGCSSLPTTAIFQRLNFQSCGFSTKRSCGKLDPFTWLQAAESFFANFRVVDE